MAKQSKAQLKDCLGVSDAIANENYERFQSWASAEPRLQAVVAYSGFAYAKLDARTLTEEQLRVGQKRLLILSGMWGPVRPLDRIKPYRLEMACKKLAPPYNKLALYWRDLSTETLLEGYNGGGDRVLVNVASDDAGRRSISRRSRRPASASSRSTSGKEEEGAHRAFEARQRVARYVFTYAATVWPAKGFDLEGYEYDASHSSDDVMVFARDSAPPKTKKARTYDVIAVGRVAAVRRSRESPYDARGDGMAWEMPPAPAYRGDGVSKSKANAASLLRNGSLEPAPPRRPLRLLRLGDGVGEVFCRDGVGAAAHGEQRALATTFARSAPEKPSARAATRSSETPGAKAARACTFNISRRPASSGSGTTTQRSRRPGRTSASSKISGRFVAASSTTSGAAAASSSFASKPSSSQRIWLSVCSRSSLCESMPRALAMASISSMNTTHGASDRAFANRLRTRASPAHEQLDEGRARARQELAVGLLGDASSEQRLARARRPRQ